MVTSCSQPTELDEYLVVVAREFEEESEQQRDGFLEFDDVEEEDEVRLLLELLDVALDDRYDVALVAVVVRRKIPFYENDQNLVLRLKVVLLDHLVVVAELSSDVPAERRVLHDVHFLEVVQSAELAVLLADDLEPVFTHAYFFSRLRSTAMMSLTSLMMFFSSAVWNRLITCDCWIEMSGRPVCTSIIVSCEIANHI